MKKDAIIIVGAGLMSIPAYDIAGYELGLETIAFDGLSIAPAAGHASHFVSVSTKDIEQCVAQAIKLQAKEFWNIRGVMCCGADVEVTVACIAAALGLPGISVREAITCNDKERMYQLLRARPWLYLRMASQNDSVAALADDPVEALANAQVVGFPCVFKPISNSGSRGVFKAIEPKEVFLAYRYAACRNEPGYAHPNRVLITPYAEGKKLTVEMMVGPSSADSKKTLYRVVSIIQTHYLEEETSPFFCESLLHTVDKTAVNIPAVEQYAIEIARDLLGIKLGAFKVDINIAPNGHIGLIEMTARLSGGFHCQTVSPLAYGTEEIKAAIKLAIGEPLDERLVQHKYERAAAVVCVFPLPGVVESIEGISLAESQVGVKKVIVNCQVGQAIGPYQNSAARVAYAIADGNTPAEAIENATVGASCITIQTSSERSSD